MALTVSSPASRAQALAFRLASQHLSARLPAGSLLRAAGECGIQNTPPDSAELALHARLAGLTPGQVERALAGERTLLQQWSLRGAPYIFPTRDAAVFSRGLVPVQEEEIRALIPGAEAALEKIGISAVAATRLAGEALAAVLDGRALTKDELGVEMAGWMAPHLTAAQAAQWLASSWYAARQSLGESLVRFVLPILALQGKCCHTCRPGRQAYLMLTSQWLGAPFPEVDPETSQAELVRRYLHCYGPATRRHFAGWAGISQAQADRAWERVQAELCAVDFNGKTAWLLCRDRAALDSPPAPEGVRFLPPHDPYLALQDRTTLLPEKALHPRLWRSSGNPGVVLVDGQLVALWRPEKKSSQLRIRVEALSALPQAALARIEAEAASLAPYKGCTSVIVRLQDFTAKE